MIFRGLSLLLCGPYYAVLLYCMITFAQARQISIVDMAQYITRLTVDHETNRYTACVWEGTRDLKPAKLVYKYGSL